MKNFNVLIIGLFGAHLLVELEFASIADFDDDGTLDGVPLLRECHLAGDWILIYKFEKDTVIFERTGSHSELLKG